MVYEAQTAERKEMIIDEEDNRPSSILNSNSCGHGNHHWQAFSVRKLLVCALVSKIHIENECHPT